MKKSKAVDSKYGTLYQVTTESNFVWAINVRRLAQLLKKEDFTEEEIVDSLISLHLVLEVSINSFFRDLVPYDFDSKFKLQAIENLDKVSFIDKVRMFICTSDFNFKHEDSEERKKYNKIIKRLLVFSEIRNLLLHGSVVMRVENSNKELVVESKAKQIITKEMLKSQINTFKYIVDGMKFYINHLDLSKNKWVLHRVSFLNYDFLPGNS